MQAESTIRRSAAKARRISVAPDRAQADAGGSRLAPLMRRRRFRPPGRCPTFRTGKEGVDGRPWRRPPWRARWEKTERGHPGVGEIAGSTRTEGNWRQDDKACRTLRIVVQLRRTAQVVDEAARETCARSASRRLDRPERPRRPGHRIDRPRQYPCQRRSRGWRCGSFRIEARSATV